MVRQAQIRSIFAVPLFARASMRKEVAFLSLYGTKW